ncbi:hypothetical protein B296_00023067 [Ensete ventricosum]|uniref:Uncharacterized protein n=1 Tax=Ensete ventricosum TaxID=4639 RepID=A0A427AFX1_ENSVE|nr:hypothetical protein B296_00023067 [Ensete ventricosum]
MLLLYGRSLADFGELSIHVFILLWSKVNQKPAFELLPRGFSIGREEKNMGAIASTWLGDNNRMELQDDGGGGWAAMEMKGGRWATTFGHTAGKQQGPTRKRKQWSSDKGLANDSNNGDAANKGGEGSSDSRGGMKRAGRRQE